MLTAPGFVAIKKRILNTYPQSHGSNKHRHASGQRHKIVGKRHRHLRPFEHRRSFSQLSARTPLHRQTRSLLGRLWRDNRGLQLCSPSARAAHLRHGNHVFRFVNKEEADPRRVYSTTLVLVLTVGLAFVCGVLGFLHPIAAALDYAAHPEFLGMMAVCVAIDAFQCIPFAYLRYQRRPIKFAALKLLFIVLNISLNLLYFLLLPALYAQLGPDSWVSAIYSPTYGVGYAFAINLVCTALITLFSNANSLVSAGRSTAVWRAKCSLMPGPFSFWVLPAF